jgi:hypothetical protein
MENPAVELAEPEGLRLREVAGDNWTQPDECSAGYGYSRENSIAFPE